MQSIVVAGLAALAAAAPMERRQAVSDATILNYALTLEHLENQFYMEGLANFTKEDFAKAGAAGYFYDNLEEISKDETTHVNFLTGALESAGAPATAACTYDFGVTDAASFLAVANVLEGVGVSAYLGAAQYISNKAYLTAAGSILTVEARHSAFLRQYQSPPESPFPSPFDDPLDFDEVYSLAAQFITACPSTNPPLPVKAFPAVAVSPAGVVKVGEVLTLTPASSVDAKAAYLITTMGPVSVPLTGSGSSYSATIPSGAQAGQAYLVLTSDTSAPTDENIVAGPALFQVADNIDSMAPPQGWNGQSWHGSYGGHGGWWGQKE